MSLRKIIKRCWRVNMELDDEELKATQELHREKKEDKKEEE